MLVSKITEEDLTVDVVDRLLFQGLEDTGEQADCIIVLGSIKAAQYRVPVAVEAYKLERAGKLVLCGGKLREFPTGRYSEAEHMRQAALELGVREEDIILENASLNTVENLRLALEALQQTLGLNRLQRVLLVTTAYHMRRSLAIAQNLFPAHVTVLPCPANDNNTRRDNWMHTPVGVKRTKDEAMKIVSYINHGIIRDFEI